MMPPNPAPPSNKAPASAAATKEAAAEAPFADTTPSSAATASETADPVRKPGAAPRVIAVANQKGGVAKTTSAVSLGGALVRLNQEVLLVDLDAQANLTLALGKDPSRMRGAITDVLFNAATILSVSRETSIPGLDLVPSNSGMDLAERFLTVRQDHELLLRQAIYSKPGDRSPNSSSAGSQPAQHLSPAPLEIYDTILLDCPPSMGAVTLNALATADLLVIPTQPEYFSAHALRAMMTAIRQVRSQFNPDLQYRILITMMDRRNRIHRQVAEQIRSTFGQAVFETVIEIDTRLRESAVEGLPITHLNLHSRSAQQYDALAREITGLPASNQVKGSVPNG